MQARDCCPRSARIDISMHFPGDRGDNLFVPTAHLVIAVHDGRARHLERLNARWHIRQRPRKHQSLVNRHTGTGVYSM